MDTTRKVGWWLSDKLMIVATLASIISFAISLRAENMAVAILTVVTWLTTGGIWIECRNS